MWNFEEFFVKFTELENEIMAGKYYVRTILALIPNCKVCVNFRCRLLLFVLFCFFVVFVLVDGCGLVGCVVG